MAKKKSAAAAARAAFDSDPPPPASSVPPPERERGLVEEAQPPPLRLLLAPEVMDKVKLTYPTIWKRMQEGTFPRARDVSPKKIAWVESEIDEWIAALPIRKFKGDDVTNEQE